MTAAHSAEAAAADDAVADAAGAPESSMEDILASIRRIIAEDQALFAADEAARGFDAMDASHEPGETAPLASPAAAASVGEAFNTLVAARFVDNSDAILAMTREALRPLLAAWLDERLPPLVERLVREEIARLAAPGRRGA